MEQPNIQLMTNKPNSAKALRRVLQVLLPIASMISFLVSYYYYYHLPSLLWSVDISALNNFSSRKAMFLLCNAILIFLAKESGLLAPSVTNIRSNEYSDAAIGEHRPAYTDHAMQVKASIVEEEMDVEKITVEVNKESDESDNSGKLAVMEEIGGGDKEVVFVEGSEHIDELNRKCEQFIEKMKREIGRGASTCLVDGS